MCLSLQILGSGSAIPLPERFSSSQVLYISNNTFLIDCGEGTQIQLKKYKIKVNKIRHIFISHLHGDHFFGLSGLIFSQSLVGREKDMHIYAPPQLQNIYNFIIQFFDIKLKFNIFFHPLNNQGVQTIYEDSQTIVQSFPLKHKVPTWGFVFKEKQKLRNIKKEYIKALNIPIPKIKEIKCGADYINENGKIYKNKELTIAPPEPKIYAYCSDTVYDEDIIPYILGANLLYHEATYANDMADKAEISFHSTAAQAATIAQKAKVKKLVIGHFSTSYNNYNAFLNEAINIFPETILAEDGLVIKIK